MKILVINPGSTSTKVAIFEDEDLLVQETLRHANEELAQFPDIFSQIDFRKRIVEDFLERNNIDTNELSAIAARGGPLPPAEGGTYLIDENLVDATRNHYVTEHPSLLAALIAHELAGPLGIESFVVDPVSVDEWDDLARISGMPELPRISLSHALNMRAVARRAARELKMAYEELNLIVVHLGGGISVSAHQEGRQIDSNNANEDGPFSPERTGTLPAAALVKLCFSGEFSVEEMKKKITKQGGMVAYLGTNDAKEAVEMADKGDEKARLILSAMMYQVAKDVGKMAAVLKGKVDAVVISGGIAHDGLLVAQIEERVSFIAPVIVYPGEDEMEALARGVLRVLRGEEEVRFFPRKGDD